VHRDFVRDTIPWLTIEVSKKSFKLGESQNGKIPNPLAVSSLNVSGEKNL
jgi:hypothetical protein